MTSSPPKLRVYFLGAGEIAVPILQKLASLDSIELIGAGTQIDRPAGRKRKLAPTPVGAAGDAAGIPVERINNVNAPDFLATLREKKPDMILVVSFGQLLRNDLLTLPRLGCVNVHASILPRYRGASPIVNAILNQDSETGITYMAMDKGLDTGAIYHIVKHPLSGTETSESLEHDLGNIGAAHLEDALLGIASGHYQPVPRPLTTCANTRKIHKQDGFLDWRHSAGELEAKIRAFHPWPGTQALLAWPDDRTLLIGIRSAKIHENHKGSPGEILRADKHGIIVCCGSGALELLEIAPPGRKVMSSSAFLNGCPVKGAAFLNENPFAAVK